MADGKFYITFPGCERITLKKDERGKTRLYRIDKANQ